MVDFMHRTTLLFMLFVAACVSPEASTTWKYKTSNFFGYTNLSYGEADTLIRRAKEDFQKSPAFLHEKLRPLSVTRVARRSDGTTLIAFSIGMMSDTRAIYVFNPKGEIVDRYLHSFWGY
jgi:hypothetical protein